MESIDYRTLEQALAFIRKQWSGAKPFLGMVLGSGWGDAVNFFQVQGEISYNQIPGMEDPTVAGHAGRLIWGEAKGMQVFLFLGRRHLFEGAGWTPIALPIYMLKWLGAKAVLLTNAAGAVNPGFAPGQLMLIEDHINLLGSNPLCGPTHETWIERFPSLSQVYDLKLQNLIKETARSLGQDLKFGVYGACLGPSYETPAEVKMLRLLGVDAVGMSTVPCAILAKAAGLRVAGLSCLSNYAAGISSKEFSHDQILNVIQSASQRMQCLLAGFIEKLSREIPKDF
jgi:purine-nucleoside phosphorylase